MRVVCAIAVLLCATFARAGAIIVSADGSGDCKTLQEAIAKIPDHSAERTVVTIKPGTYSGQLVLPKTKTNVSFVGTDLEKCILTYALNQNEPAEGVDRMYRGAGVLILADGFRAEKLTFQNTSGNHGQAMALRIDADRVVVKGCRITGWQDTLYINAGRQYFTGCYISGRVDFIYGSATAVFDHCEIHSRNGGHITAASTPQDHPFGFVFLDCKLTGDAIPWNDPPATQPDKLTPLADLGRPWRPYAAVAYLRCDIGDHIKPQGWDNWRKAENEKTARYSEYNNTGPGARTDARFAWTHQLTADEAAKYTLPNILGGADHWDPTTD